MTVNRAQQKTYSKMSFTASIRPAFRHHGAESCRIRIDLRLFALCRVGKPCAEESRTPDVFPIQYVGRRKIAPRHHSPQCPVGAAEQAAQCLFCHETVRSIPAQGVAEEHRRVSAADFGNRFRCHCKISIAHSLLSIKWRAVSRLHRVDFYGKDTIEFQKFNDYMDYIEVSIDVFPICFRRTNAVYFEQIIDSFSSFLDTTIYRDT